MRSPFPTLGALLGLLVLLPACEDSLSGAEQLAGLRVVHASPDAPNVDVVVDGVSVLEDVPFKAFSDYLRVPAGERRVQVRVAGTTTTVLDLAPTFAVGSETTVIAKGLVASLGALPLTDDNGAPAAGNIKLRLVHGAPSAPTVDIYVTAPAADLATATPTLTDIPFEGVSPYLEVPAGTYRVRITPANDPATVAIDTGALTLAAGQIRTAIAVDATGGGAPFGVILLADRN